MKISKNAKKYLNREDAKDAKDVKNKRDFFSNARFIRSSSRSSRLRGKIFLVVEVGLSSHKRQER
jgi:hypothetical protein